MQNLLNLLLNQNRRLELSLGRPADAAASFRADLEALDWHANPGNGWSYTGLAVALAALRDPGAAAAKRAAAAAFAHAGSAPVYACPLFAPAA